MRLAATIILSSVLTFTLSSISQAQIFIKIDRKGVQVGETKIDPVPPTVRVLEKVLEGKPLDKAVEQTVKDKIDEVKSSANLPLIQNDIENKLLGDVRGILGDDIANGIATLNLPNQIQRVLPSAVVGYAERLVKGEAKVQDPAAIPLAAALKQAKSYYSDRAAPIPKAVKLLLVQTFPADVLNNARYVVDSFGSTVPASINALHETLGETHAVTVDNIIVFSKTPNDADIWFWAHEMQHTVQYKRMGIDAFASSYIANYRELESEANTIASDAEKNAQKIIQVLNAIAGISK